MKKLLLSAAVLGSALTASAQMNGTDGFIWDNTDSLSNCHLTTAPNNGGIMSDGGSIVGGGNYLATAQGPIVLNSEGAIPPGSAATWFALPVADQQTCGSLNSVGGGVDLTNQSKVTIQATSTMAGATLEFFLGGAGQWTPSTSTYNVGTGSSIIASHTFAAMNQIETFTFDYNALDSATWAGWAGRDSIQSVGFRSGTSLATFAIISVKIGSAFDMVTGTEAAVASDVNVYPNPATDVLNVNVGTGNANVSLTDVAGNVVASASGSGTLVISVADLAAGLYGVTVQSAEGTSTTKVLVQ